MSTIAIGSNYDIQVKGQLILEWKFGVLNFPKKQRNFFLQISALESRKCLNKKIKTLYDTLWLWISHKMICKLWYYKKLPF